MRTDSQRAEAASSGLGRGAKTPLTESKIQNFELHDMIRLLPVWETWGRKVVALGSGSANGTKARLVGNRERRDHGR